MDSGFLASLGPGMTHLANGRETAALFSPTIIANGPPGGPAEGRFHMFRTAIGAVLGTAVLATVLAMPAGAQQDRMQGGSLECSLSSSIGMVVTSSRNVACNFKPRGGPPEAYVGTLTRVGLDIGITGGGAIIWGVFTSTNLYAGMLSGTYVGASAEASIAAGLGANVLVGGSNRSVALQPLSVQGQTGLNIAAGVSQLELHLAQ